MDDTNFKFEVINAIAYSRLVSKTFSPGECIHLHLWKNQGIEPSKALKNKFIELTKFIKHWNRPEMKYDEGLQLYYQCPETLQWKKVINNQYYNGNNNESIKS